MGAKHSDRVSDELVCQSYRQFERALHRGVASPTFPQDWLMAKTGESRAVCRAAAWRAVSEGLVEFGTCIRTGWLTYEGRDLIGLISDEEKADQQEALDRRKRLARELAAAGPGRVVRLGS